MAPDLTSVEVLEGVREEVVVASSQLRINEAYMLFLVKCYDKK